MVDALGRDRREYAKTYYDSIRLKHFIENPRHYLYITAKCRAKQLNRDFMIDEEDIVVPTHCPILGIELTKGRGWSETSMSLDRVNNDLGYVKGNVRVISKKANRIKNQLTIPLAELMIKYMKGEL